MLPFGFATFICASSIDRQTVHSRLSFFLIQESGVVGAIRYDPESYDANSDRNQSLLLDQSHSLSDDVFARPTSKKYIFLQVCMSPHRGILLSPMAKRPPKAPLDAAADM